MDVDLVCAMEDMLEVYQRDFEDGEVLVCLDETSKQLTVVFHIKPIPISHIISAVVRQIFSCYSVFFPAVSARQAIFLFPVEFFL